LVWGVINDNQTPNWTQIRDGNRYEGAQGSFFGFGSFGETPFASLAFDDIPDEQWTTINDNQTPNWQTIDDSQAGNWVQVNDGNTVTWVQIPT
jgi:hypothetical protein